MFTLADLLLRATNERELLRARGVISRLTIIGETDVSVSATAAGSDGSTYTVELHDNLDGECTCVSWDRSGARKFCKHVGALALRWLERLGVAAGTEAIDAELAEAISLLPEIDCKQLLAAFAGNLVAQREQIIAASAKRKR